MLCAYCETVTDVLCRSFSDEVHSWAKQHRKKIQECEFRARETPSPGRKTRASVTLSSLKSTQFPAPLSPPRNPHMCQCHSIHHKIHICASVILSSMKSTHVPVPFYPPWNQHNFLCHFVHHEIHTCASVTLSTMKSTQFPMPFSPPRNPHMCQCHFIHTISSAILSITKSTPCQCYFIHHETHTDCSCIHFTLYIRRTLSLFRPNRKYFEKTWTATVQVVIHFNYRII